jgi:hypothetical protein
MVAMTIAAIAKAAVAPRMAAVIVVSPPSNLDPRHLPARHSTPKR